MNALNICIDRIIGDMQKLLEEYTITINEVRALVGEDMWTKVSAEHQQRAHSATVKPIEQPLVPEDSFSFDDDEEDDDLANSFIVLESYDRIASAMQLERMSDELGEVSSGARADFSDSKVAFDTATEEEDTCEDLPQDNNIKITSGGTEGAVSSLELPQNGETKFTGGEFWARVAAAHEERNSSTPTKDCDFARIPAEPTDELEQDTSLQMLNCSSEGLTRNGFLRSSSCVEGFDLHDVSWKTVSDISDDSDVLEPATEKEESSDAFPEDLHPTMSNNINCEQSSEGTVDADVSEIIPASERLRNFFGAWNKGTDLCGHGIQVPEKSELNDDPQFSLNKKKRAPQRHAKKLPKKVADKLKKEKKKAKETVNPSDAQKHDYLVCMKKEMVERLTNYLNNQKEIRENLSPLKIFKSPPVIQAVLLLIKPTSTSPESHVQSFLEKRQYEHRIAGCDRLMMFYSALSELYKNRNYTEFIAQDVAYLMRKHSDESLPESFAKIEAVYYYHSKEDTMWQSWDFVPAHLKQELSSDAHKTGSWTIVD